MGAVTADGFVGFFKEIVDMYGLKKLYIIKGGSGVGKSTFMRKFAELFPLNPKMLVYCSNDPKSLDGVIIEDLGIGMIDGTAPHMTDPKYPGLCEEIIDLAGFIDSERLASTATIQAVKQRADEKTVAYNEAYTALARARTAHAKLESMYTGAVDFESIDKFFDAKFRS